MKFETFAIIFLFTMVTVCLFKIGEFENKFKEIERMVSCERVLT